MKIGDDYQFVILILYRNIPELTSKDRDDVNLYREMFRSKEFLHHEPQSLPSYVTENAYNKEENCEGGPYF